MALRLITLDTALIQRRTEITQILIIIHCLNLTDFYAQQSRPHFKNVYSLNTLKERVCNQSPVCCGGADT